MYQILMNRSLKIVNFMLHELHPYKKKSLPSGSLHANGEKTISKQYTWQTKCPWTNEEIAVHLYNRTSLQHKEMNRDTQQHG